MFWGIGHTATLFIVGVILIFMKGEIPEEWAMSLEFLVGIMLVYLGVTTILSLKNIHIHQHEHDGEEHKHVHAHEHKGQHKHNHQNKNVSYLKSMLIGLVHGLAGSGAMILLTMSTVNSAWEGAIYILIFGAGRSLVCFSLLRIICIHFFLCQNAI